MQILHFNYLYIQKTLNKLALRIKRKIIILILKRKDKANLGEF